MTEWYYAPPNTRERRGPVSENTLRTMLDDGELPFHALVWREGFAGWVPARNVFTPSAGAAPGAFAPGTDRLPLPAGLRRWMLFDGVMLVLSSILPSMFLLGIPLLLAGIAVLRAATALDPRRGIDASALPFYGQIRFAAVAFGIFSLLCLIVSALLLPALALADAAIHIP
jgi:hypothetical protein